MMAVLIFLKMSEHGDRAGRFPHTIPQIPVTSLLSTHTPRSDDDETAA
jgi:hypothetical protein